MLEESLEQRLNLMRDEDDNSQDDRKGQKKVKQGKRLYFLKELNFGDKKNFEKDMRKYYLIKYEQQNRRGQEDIIVGEF